MLPLKTIEDLIKKHTSLDKELTTGEVDKKLFAEKSKEYSELNDIIKNAKKFISYAKDKLDLEENSIVYTSGSGGNFRAGLPIGIINNQLDNLAVEFFSDLSQLSYVKIQSIKTLEE